MRFMDKISQNNNNNRMEMSSPINVTQSLKESDLNNLDDDEIARMN